MLDALLSRDQQLCIAEVLQPHCNNAFRPANLLCDYAAYRAGVTRHIGEGATIEAVYPMHQVFSEETGHTDAQADS